jgi:hypothetical protein
MRRAEVRGACVSISQHTSAYVSIRQHTSAYISIRPLWPFCLDAEESRLEDLYAVLTCAASVVAAHALVEA